MTNTTISALPETLVIDGTTVVPADYDGATYKVTADTLKSYIGGIPVGAAISLQLSGATVTIDGSVYQKNQTTVAYNPSLHDLVKLKQNASSSLFYGTEQTSGVFSAFNAIAYSASLQLHVAVGTAGLISTSPDGVTWTTRVSNTTVALNGVYFANSLFVAVGASGVILTSTDGISWTVRLSGVTTALQNIVYSTTDSKFFVSGDNLLILSSPTGTTWTKVFDGRQVNGIAYSAAADVYVAVGAAGAVYTSPDGVVWTYQVSGVTTALQAVAFSSADTLFVAVGAGGIILTSPTGTTWTVRSSGTANALNGITYATDKDLFVAVGATGTIVTSQDGISWTLRTSPTTGILNAVSYSQADSVFVAVGNTGVGVQSSDGFTWSLTLSNQQVNSIAFDGSTYVAVGAGGAIWTSTDTVNWSFRQSTTSNSLNAVAYSSADTLFVAVGAGGTIVTSPTGTTWTARTSGTTAILLGIAYSSADDIFVAVGAGGAVITSSNGTTWTARTSNTTSQLNAITYSTADDRFVAVGAAGTAITSSDGVTWSIALGGATFQSVAYSSSLDLYVAVGNAGVVYTSPDQNAWTFRVSGIATQLNAVAWSSDFNLFIAVGASGVIITSPDGATWTARTSGTTTSLNGVAAGNNLVIIGGGSVSSAVPGGGYSYFTDYVLLRSTNGTTYASQTSDVWGRYTIGTVGFHAATNTFSIGADRATICTSTDGITWVNRQGSSQKSGVAPLNAYKSSTATLVSGGFAGSIQCATNLTDAVYVQILPYNTATNFSGGDYSTSLNLFCIVGTGGIIYTSPDGLTWTSQTSGTTANLYCCSWDAALGLFIVTGEGKILTSTNGTAWTTQISAGGTLIGLSLNTTTSTWYAISTTACYTSTNGTTWTLAGVPTNFPGVATIYFALTNRFYATASNNNRVSTDGLTWNSTTNVGDSSNTGVTNGTVWVACGGSGGSGNLTITTDGVNFTTVPNSLLSSQTFRNGYWDSVSQKFIITAQYGGIFTLSSTGGSLTQVRNPTNVNSINYSSSITTSVAGGNYAGYAPFPSAVYRTTNGTNWVQVNPNLAGFLNEIVYDSTTALYVYVATGIYTSADLLTWAFQTAASTIVLNTAIANATDGIMLMGNSNSRVRSTNGTLWTASFVGTTQALNGITYGSTDDLFVAVGAAGNVLTSPNGTAWTYQTPPTTAVFNAIAYDSTNDLFVAVGAAGAILTSPDAITWTARVSTTTLALTCAYFDTTNKNLVGGATGTLLASPDGANWTARTVSTAQNLLGTAYGSADDLFVVVGATGTILTSPNGSDWTARTSGVTTQLNAVTYDSTTDLFVVVGNPIAAGYPSTILTSSAGTTWTARVTQVPWNLTCITSTSTDGFVVGSNAGFIKSPNGTTWVPTMAFFTPGSLIIRNSDNQYLATGSFIILKSTNPSAWTISYYDASFLTPQTIPAASAYVSISIIVYAADLNLFVAVGTRTQQNEGYVYTSSDAVTWTKTVVASFVNGGSTAPASIQYGNGLFMFSNGLVVQTSSDAVTWTPYYSSTPFAKISYDTNNTKFVLAGGSGQVSTQPATFTGNPNSVVPSIGPSLNSSLFPYMRTL